MADIICEQSLIIVVLEVGLCVSNSEKYKISLTKFKLDWGQKQKLYDSE